MLNAKNFGVSAGIIWGAVMFLGTILAVLTGYAASFFSAIAGIYVGYTVTWVGSIVGLIYGFIDAFIAFYLFALLYNWLEKKKKK